jgi:hypothetical protein
MAGHWRHMANECPYFPAELLGVRGSIEAMYGGDWWLPEQFFSEGTEGPFGARTFSDWLHAGTVLHPPTETLLGGPYGLKWPVLHLLRAHWTLVNLQNGGPYGRRTKAGYDIGEVLQIVNSDILWLLGHLRDSAVKLSTWRKVQLVPIEWPELNGASRAERHQKPPLLVCRFILFELISDWTSVLRHSPQTQTARAMTLGIAPHPVS